MRKFRFIGDPDEYDWNQNPKTGKSYTIEELTRLRGSELESWMIERDSNWQEVTKTNHKDTDLGYFAGLAMQGILSHNGSFAYCPNGIVSDSIMIAKELIKKLDKEAEL